MSKNKRRSKRQTSRSKKRQQESTLSSLIIPIIVGVVILAIVVGAIFLNESRLGSTSSAAGNISVPVTTARAQPTSQIPYPNVPRISLDETKSKLDSGQLVLVDVRSRNSYDQSHAVGAVSIPEQEIGSRLNELPRDKEIVLYCT
jgi:flagellar basal body-associated protein FliL